MPSDLDKTRLPDLMSGVLDDVRRSVHGALGTRTYRVQIVSRQWSEGEIGAGRASVSILELDPRPLVSRRAGDRMGPAGREAAGDIILTEVSLKYSATDLQPPVMAGLEFAYRIIDDGGQGQADQWCGLGGDPVSRRGDRKADNCDWYVLLKETSAMGDLDAAA